MQGYIKGWLTARKNMNVFVILRVHRREELVFSEAELVKI